MPRLNTPIKKAQDINLYNPMKGLNLDLDGALIGDDETPNCRDIVFRDRAFSKVPGTAFFGMAAVNSEVIISLESFPLIGSTQVLMHTTTKVYRYNSATSLFVELQSGLTATVDKVVKGDVCQSK